MKIKKILLVLPLITLSGCISNKTKDVFEFRYYFLHTNFIYSDDFYIELRGSGADNQFINYQSEKSVKSFEINDATKEYYLCYFDIPTSIESAIFYNMKVDSQIGDYGHSNYFEIKYKNILICENKGYSFPGARTADSFYTSSSFFASYIVSSLDINSDSFCDGFNSYEYLNEVFYSPIVSNEGESAFDNYIWFDKSMNKTVSFNEKWNLIQSKSETFKQQNARRNITEDFIYITFGILLLTLCIFALFIGIMMLIIKRKKEVKNV